MQVQVQAPSDDMIAQVEQLLRFHLTRLEGRVDNITVTVEVFRDPLETSLFRCGVQVQTGRDGDLRIDETQSDLGLAMTRALDRCMRTLRRRCGGVGSQRLC